MSKNLWNLDLNSLENESPLEILKEQADYLEEDTDNLLLVKLFNSKPKTFLNEKPDYDNSTYFNLVAPKLDNYTYHLFTIYFNMVEDYPVSIYLNYNEPKNQILSNVYNYTCNTPDEFRKALSEILTDERTSRIVKSLYKKSNTLKDRYY